MLGTHPTMLGTTPCGLCHTLLRLPREVQRGAELLARLRFEGHDTALGPLQKSLPAGTVHLEPLLRDEPRDRVGVSEA